MKSASSKKKKITLEPPKQKTKYLYVRLTPENDAFIEEQAKSKKVSRARVVDAILEYARSNNLM